MLKLIFRRVIKSSPFPFVEDSIYVATTMKDPARCIKLLKKEHIRVKSTMQSFEKLLDTMQHQSRSENIVSEKHMNDLNEFLKFCRIYNDCHHKKEEIIYEQTINTALKHCIENEHTHTKNIYHLITKKSLKESNENKMDDVIIAIKSFINLLYNHMSKEDNIIYPMILLELKQSEMENISQQMEQFNTDNKDVINAMELLSDELVDQYK